MAGWCLRSRCIAVGVSLLTNVFSPHLLPRLAPHLPTHHILFLLPPTFSIPSTFPLTFPFPFFFPSILLPSSRPLSFALLSTYLKTWLNVLNSNSWLMHSVSSYHSQLKTRNIFKENIYTAVSMVFCFQKLWMHRVSRVRRQCLNHYATTNAYWWHKIIS